MGLLQLVNYTHNNPWRNDGPLYFMGVTFGTLPEAAESNESYFVPTCVIILQNSFLFPK